MASIPVNQDEKVSREKVGLRPPGAADRLVIATDVLASKARRQVTVRLRRDVVAA